MALSIQFTQLNGEYHKNGIGKLSCPFVYFFLGVRLAQPYSLKSGSESLNSLFPWKNCFQSSFLPRALV